MDAKAIAQRALDIEHEVVSAQVPGARSIKREATLPKAEWGLRDLLRREGSRETEVAMENPALHRVAVAYAIRYGLGVSQRPGMADHEFVVSGPKTFIHAVYWPVVELVARMLEEEFTGLVEDALRRAGAPLQESDRRR